MAEPGSGERKGSEAAPISMTTPEETILGRSSECGPCRSRSAPDPVKPVEEASRDNAWLLVGRIAAPLLARLETKTHEMLEQGRVDRRGEGGDLWRDLRKLSALMADLPSPLKSRCGRVWHLARNPPTCAKRCPPWVPAEKPGRNEVEDSVPPCCSVIEPC